MAKENRGSVLVTYDEIFDSRGIGLYDILINGNTLTLPFFRKRGHKDITDLYTTFIYVGNTLSVRVNGSVTGSTEYVTVNILRIDYTTDDEGGNMGITETFITGNTLPSVNTAPVLLINNLPISKAINAYGFEYVIDISSSLTPPPSTPTPTPTATPTPTPTGPTPTPTPTPTSTPTPLPAASIDTSYSGNTIYWVRDINVFDNNDIGLAQSGGVNDSAAILLTNSGNTIANITKGPYLYYPLNKQSLTIEKINSNQYLIGDGSAPNSWSVAGWSTLLASYIYLPSIVNLNSGFTYTSSYSGATTATVNKIRTGRNFGTNGELIVASNYISNVTGSTLNFFDGAGNGKFSWDFVQQTDNKIIGVGNFTRIGSSSGPYVGYIARFNTTSNPLSLDTSFSGGTGFDGTVSGIDIQSDGKVVCVGEFTSHNGVSASGIIRLNTDGTRDTTFSGVTTGFDVVGYYPNSRKVKIQSDGKIIVVGLFSVYNGVSSRGMVRINTNGSIDSTFGVGTGFSGGLSDVGCWRIDIDNSGKYLVGGDFTTYNGNPTNSTTIRLNP